MFRTPIYNIRRVTGRLPLYRLAAPSQNNLQVLEKKYNIKNFIDLRSPTEKRVSPLSIAEHRDYTMHHVNFYHGNFLYNAVWSRCNVKEKAHMLSLVAQCKIDELTKYIGTIIGKGNLQKMYCDLIDYSQKEISETLKLVVLLLERNDGAVSYFCSYGCDRTGIISALIKKSLREDDNDILDDYCVSETELQCIMPKRKMVLHSQGLTDDFCYPKRDVMKNTFAHINDKYGSVLSYLISIGFDVKWQCRLLKLTCPSHIQVQVDVL